MLLGGTLGGSTSTKKNLPAVEGKGVRQKSWKALNKSFIVTGQQQVCQSREAVNVISVLFHCKAILIQLAIKHNLIFYGLFVSFDIGIFLQAASLSFCLSLLSVFLSVPASDALVFKTLYAPAIHEGRKHVIQDIF